jgi:hypothetical protein
MRRRCSNLYIGLHVANKTKNSQPWPLHSKHTSINRSGLAIPLTLATFSFGEISNQVQHYHVHSYTSTYGQKPGVSSRQYGNSSINLQQFFDHHQKPNYGTDGDQTVHTSLRRRGLHPSRVLVLIALPLVFRQYGEFLSLFLPLQVPEGLY